MGICGVPVGRRRGFALRITLPGKINYSLLPAKPGTMIELGGVWNTFKDTSGLYALQNS
jgi:hypothetical protein